MLNINEIKAYMVSLNRAFDFDVRLRPSDETIMLYVPQERVAPIVRTGFTSLRQLKGLSKKLAEKFGGRSEVILVQDEAQQELESGFYQMLNRKFNDQIVSLYISFRDESVVDAFIEVSELNDGLQREIETHYKNILEEAALRLGDLQWLESPSNLPSLIALLRSLKALQPIDLQGLTEELQGDYSSLSDKWVNHKLDQLRKKGLVMRQKSTGTYVLTDSALGVVPAGARYTSSDIDRALALGRRKW